MEILIYYQRYRKEFIVREDPKGDELSTHETARAAKDWVAEHHPRVTTHFAMPGGIRELKWITKCDCCGRDFEHPHLK